MSLDFVQNFVRGELFAPMTDTDTSIDVQDVTGFPNPDNKGAYNMVIFDQTQFARPSEDSVAEIVRLTSVKNGSEFNVLRGQENTFPAAHPVGSAVYLSATAKVFDDVEQDISAVQSDADANTQSINNLPDDFVVSGEGREFEVQKDGTDGQGIINFKT
jgi:hypothetical protein